MEHDPFVKNALASSIDARAYVVQIWARNPRSSPSWGMSFMQFSGPAGSVVSPYRGVEPRALTPTPNPQPPTRTLRPKPSYRCRRGGTRQRLGSFSRTPVSPSPTTRSLRCLNLPPNTKSPAKYQIARCPRHIFKPTNLTPSQNIRKQ